MGCWKTKKGVTIRTGNTSVAFQKCMKRVTPRKMVPIWFNIKKCSTIQMKQDLFLQISSAQKEQELAKAKAKANQEGHSSNSMQKTGSEQMKKVAAVRGAVRRRRKTSNTDARKVSCSADMKPPTRTTRDTNNVGATATNHTKTLSASTATTNHTYIHLRLPRNTNGLRAWVVVVTWNMM